ncbi:hypothetical protein FSP39_009910 [Pinctada imbricata]|uniref:Uncharacterized protein n=1 Tax=Pinctada imbricata TaxID=66713 RepID=A0AA89BQF2_PINIB|nr:hypothetical protein FSP39_009910 [Pinctada imbricata]
MHHICQFHFLQFQYRARLALPPRKFGKHFTLAYLKITITCGFKGNYGEELVNNFGKPQNFTESSVTVQKSPGHKLLSSYLGYEKYDEDADIQGAVHTDFVYDNIMFGVEKGFPWEQVCAIAKFCNGLLKESIGNELTESLRYLKLQSFELTPILGERNFTIFMDQLFATFMRHFKLYQFVFTKNRQDMTPKVKLNIEVAEDPSKLKDGKTVDVWEYEEKYRKLQEKEAEKINKKLLKKAEVLEKTEKDRTKKMNDISDVQKPLSKEAIGSIIQDVIKTYSTALIEKVTCDIETVTEDLECKLERTSLPRPQALGAPPRFDLKPKTPVATPPKPKTPPKSPKAGRKKSGSASRSRSRASKS